jgi:GntR family transcriptional regulator
MSSGPRIDADEFGAIPEDRSPLYSRIISVMQKRIQQGTTSPGAKLPSEEQLAKHFGVSSITMRAALKGLAESGIIERRQGRGTFVREPSKKPTEWSLGSIEDLVMTSRLSDVVLAHHGFRSPPAWAKSHLGTLPGGRAFNLQVVRHQKKIPFLFTDAYFPPAVGERLGTVDVARQLERNRLLIGMVEEVVGERYANIRQTIVAATSSAAVARMLRIRAGTPVLLITRLSWAADGRLLQVARSYYQTRGFAYSIHLTRG